MKMDKSRNHETNKCPDGDDFEAFNNWFLDLSSHLSDSAVKMYQHSLFKQKNHSNIFLSEFSTIGEIHSFSSSTYRLKIHSERFANRSVICKKLESLNLYHRDCLNFLPH